ncbi:type I polyketide synthase, partial [Saccharopolyspora elongata]
PNAIPTHHTFHQLGYDSVTAIQLRNQLTATTQVSLPTTLIYDHPTPAQLATFVLSQLVPDSPQSTIQVASRTSAADEPIAIVGMACHFPGGVNTPENLWELVSSGTDAITGFPTNRGWNLDDLFDPDPDAVGKSYSRHGGFLDNPAGFDAAFFNISPREALAMDPQQRLLLETTWEAVENAGIDPDSLRGANAGVFTGTNGQDYAAVLRQDHEQFEGFVATGNTASVMSGRISYTLGLEGPAVTVDTACSSSLVAMHLACQSLRSGESGLALAGGATVMATPGIFLEFSRQRGVARDGKCKAFGSGADGTVFSEGVGVVVLERLSDAERNGHRILAVIRGSAVNQDGASNGLTAPSGPSQERVIEQALANAGLAPSDIDAVEAHGTGTALGDPIEAQALLATYGRHHTKDRPLWLGSLKSNIGHTQAAAGVAGIIKMVQALHHDELPATLHAETPSTHVDWSDGTVALLSRPQPWPDADRPRRAAVSSFGVSGTNAHVILEQPSLGGSTRDDLVETQDVGSALVPWAVSAKTPEALEAHARRLHTHLSGQDGWEPVDVGAALSKRSAFSHRAVLLGEDRQNLLQHLADLASGTEAPGIIRPTQIPTRSADRIVMVFPGQGGQWPGMGRELLDTNPVFTTALAECDQALSRYQDWSVTDLLRNGDALERVDVIQPALFAVMVSLARVWQSYGVRPAAVVGHSQGEIAAAHIAGALDLDQAARVVALRSQLIRTHLAGHGSMLSTALSVDDLKPHLDERASIAAINSPTATVLSGDTDAIHDLHRFLSEQDIRSRILPVDYASHSHHVETLRQPLLDQLAGLTPQTSEIPFHSTVTGETLDTTGLDADYWYTNLATTVNFHRTITRLHTTGHHVYLEPSPHPTLTHHINHPDAITITTLRRDHDSGHQLLANVSLAHTHHVAVDWAPHFPNPRHLDLPTYAFQHQDFWLSPRSSGGDPDGLGLTATGHPLLTARTDVPGTGEILFTGRVSARTNPWLAEHVVQGRMVLPGTVFAEMALLAAGDLGGHEVEELVLQSPLTLSGDDQITLNLVVACDESGRHAITIHSRSGDDDWVCHATGTLVAQGASSDEEPVFETWPPRGATPVDVVGLYDDLADHGFEYGPTFQGLHSAWQHGDDIYAEVGLDEDHRGDWVVHPALLDAALHTAFLIGWDTGLRLPFSWKGVRAHRGATRLRVRLRRTGDALQVVTADDRGRFVAGIDSLTLRPVTGPAHDPLFRLSWLPHGLAEEAAAAQWVRIEPDANLDELCRQPVPDVVVADFRTDERRDSGVPGAVARTAQQAVDLVQSWLAREELASTRLVLLTRNAVAAQPGEVPDLVTGPLWGLLRVAQNEHPDRILLVDVDLGADLDDVLGRAVGMAMRHGEWQLAVRGDAILVPRLIRAKDALTPPEGRAWRLDVTERGSIDNLHLASFPQVAGPLEAGQVRVAVRAVGVNFRDVLNTLGMYPGTPPLGAEGAGVIAEIADEVTDLRVGDRVWGILPGAMGPLAITDHRLLARVPQDWTFAQAAATPAVFLTAYHALHGLAEVQPGQKVLVHAAAGGVGMAAIQLLQHYGADIYATAHPSKWSTLRELGIPEDHIASSRTTEFATRFPAVNVVLNSLTGELLDASLELLTPGGHFIELGKTDPRDPAEHPNLHYHAFDLTEVDPTHLQAMLGDLTALFDQEHIHPLPVTAWDIRQAPEAFRHLSNARHTGKLALTIPTAPDPRGTILITGGTGALGTTLARHLAAQHPGHLLLASRQGPAAPNAKSLRDELTALGTKVTITACDTTDPRQLADLIDGIPAEHPLTGVVHTVGALRDSALHALTAEQLAAVLESKVDSTWHLHHATRHHDLAFFTVYSSAAGILGNPGQANYAAANTFLDAFAQHRHARGLPAQSLAWGPWDTTSGMTEHLSHTDRDRMAAGGVLPFGPDDGMAAFDAARDLPDPHVVPLRLDGKALRSHGDALPPLFGEVIRRRAQDGRRSNGPEREALLQRLASLPEAEQRRTLLELICSRAAVVLGHADAGAITADRPFLELGFDSLTAVELRNRLATATGRHLPTTLVFDHATPAELADFLRKSIETPENPVLQQRSGEESSPVDDELVRSYRQLGDLDRFDEGIELLKIMSRLRPAFDAGDPSAAVEPVPLTRGGTGPGLICFPSLVAPTSPYQFARFASVFRDQRPAQVLPTPGYQNDEPLPATLTAAIETQADKVLECAGGEPIVLVGYSSGGWFAYAVTALLEQRGAAPVALVLLDSPAPGGGCFAQMARVAHRLDGTLPNLRTDQAQLTAMGAYLRLFEDWTPGPVSTPLLFVHPERETPDFPRNLSADAAPDDRHVLFVPGDHFTMIDRYAEQTASLVDGWITTNFEHRDECSKVR